MKRISFFLRLLCIEKKYLRTFTIKKTKRTKKQLEITLNQTIFKWMYYLQK